MHTQNTRFLSSSFFILILTALFFTSCKPVDRSRSVLGIFDTVFMLDLHNITRESYEVPPLVWDIGLEEEAAIWALDLADTGCIASPSDDPLYGEIVFDSVSPLTEEEAFDLWLDEENNYDSIDHTCLPNTSCDRFTQIMWFETEKVGCAQAICDRDLGEVWVCKYDPPGNQEGVNPF